MPEPVTKTDLVARLQRQAEALGLKPGEASEHGVTAEIVSILAKWWFGGRKVIYRMACGLTEADHTVHFREAIVETSWGIPPPTLTVETTTLSGTQLSGKRHDVSIGGGGALNYSQMRHAIEQTTAAAGWTFQFEAGRMP